MKYFFSVDWGTSSLRVRFVGVQDSSIVILHETTNQQGCGYVYEAFQNEKETCSREEYFLQHLRPYLILPPSISIEEPIPVVISGMASSSIGIREIPYSTLPFALDGNSLRYERIPATPAFDHDVLLLSGVCSTNDVMRGEEVQLLGLQQHSLSSDALYILPGTHSKHIRVKDNNAIAFKTYITGEIFQVLSTYSLLKNSITKSASIDQEAFLAGVKLSESNNILHEVFTIRGGSVLQKTNNESNYSLLSGLLIGTELRSITDPTISIYLCAHGNLSNSYELAIQALSMQNRCTIIPSQQVDESVIYGQKKILDTVQDQSY